jgi:flagellin
MGSYVNAQANNRELDKSLERLSSGLRINKAADDASGMAIADKLRSQGNSLGQAIKNANDATGIIQIADKAMDEQLKILDTIKVKATQAAQDGQTNDTRKAIQADVDKLLKSLDDIATTTSFNGQSLLNGSFTNKSFQVGSSSNQTVDFTVNSTHSTKVGDVRFETTTITGVGSSTLTFSAVDGVNDVTLESVSISTSVGTGIGALADTINKNSDLLGGVKASWTNVATTSASVGGGDIISLTINGVNIGSISSVDVNDKTGKLVNAINEVTDQTGVEAYTDARGNLNLRSTDGRGISVGASSLTAMGSTGTSIGSFGRLTLTRVGGKDIKVSDTGVTKLSGASQTTINLGDMKGGLSADQASAIGANTNSSYALGAGNDIGAGVTTMAGAMAMMEVADAAIKQLDKVRSNIGSTQNQLNSTVDNISVTRVNVAAAESQIRDVDFAQESASFQKHNILAQAGSYAMSQANQLQQNVQRLLQ